MSEASCRLTASLVAFCWNSEYSCSSALSHPGQPWQLVQPLQEALLQVSKSTLMKSRAEPSPSPRPRQRQKQKPRPAPEPSTRQTLWAVARFRSGWLAAAGTQLVSLSASPTTLRERLHRCCPRRQVSKELAHVHGLWLVARRLRLQEDHHRVTRRRQRKSSTRTRIKAAC